MGPSVGVVLLAGPSGCGKSYLAHKTGLPVLCLDDFYKDGDDSTLPKLNGKVNWESPQAWNAAAAIETIIRLITDGSAEVPVYAIGEDRRVATRILDLNGSPLFIAEGIFAAEIGPECRRRGLLVEAYALSRPRALTFVRRLGRDLAEQRKPPAMLVRRGLALLRTEPAVLRRQVELGCRAVRASQVLRELTTRATAAEPRTLTPAEPRTLTPAGADARAAAGHNPA